MDIRERIMEIIKNDGLKINSFSQKIGAAQSSIQSMFDKSTEPSYKTIIKILNAYPLISAEWLLRGEGSMYKAEHEHKHYNIDMHKEGSVEGHHNNVGNTTTNNESNAELLNIIKMQQEQIKQLISKL